MALYKVAPFFGVLMVFTFFQTHADQLNIVKTKGNLHCGVSEGLTGFSEVDASGKWKGLDVDFCRAISAAIFGDPNKVEFVPLSSSDRFLALQSGEIDILSRNTTWTMGRDTLLGLNFAGVNYYDGQGFMVRKSLGITDALELDGVSICVAKDTTTKSNVEDYFRTHKMNFEVVAFEKADEVIQAYDAGRCDVYSSDVSALFSQRLKMANPDEHMILPTIISKEPLGPVVRHGDEQWYDISKWVHNAMLTAEELGVKRSNVDQMLQSQDPAVKRLLGVESKLGESLGLNQNWAYNVIKHVGNYSEVFERNLGSDSEINVERGLNKLWSNGGIQYSPPIR